MAWTKTDYGDFGPVYTVWRARSHKKIRVRHRLFKKTKVLTCGMTIPFFPDAYIQRIDTNGELIIKEREKETVLELERENNGIP